MQASLSQTLSTSVLLCFIFIGFAYWFMYAISQFLGLSKIYKDFKIEWFVPDDSYIQGLSVFVSLGLCLCMSMSVFVSLHLCLRLCPCLCFSLSPSLFRCPCFSVLVSLICFSVLVSVCLCSCLSLFLCLFLSLIRSALCSREPSR